MLVAIEKIGFEPSIRQSDLLKQAAAIKQDLPANVESLLNRGAPILIYFGAPWCGACKIMERTTFQDEEVIQALDRLQYLKVDVEQDVHTGAAFAVSAVPMIVVLDDQGSERYRHVGPLTADEMRLVLVQFTKTVRN